MNNIDEVKRKLAQIYPTIQSISSSILYLELFDLNDHSDFKSLLSIMNLLHDLKLRIEVLIKPVVAEGTLHKNTSGRYEIDEHHSFMGGSSIELLSFDLHGNTVWIRTMILHNGDDYYAVGMPNVPLENLQARVREE